MKRNAPKNGSGKRSASQEPYCVHRNLGRGRYGNCGYGRRSTNFSSGRLVSIMSSLLGGILELADSSIRRLSTGVKNSNLLGDGSRKSGASLPDLEYRREDDNHTQSHTGQLTQNNEESQLIADKQK